MSKFLRTFVFVTIAFSFLLAACGTSATPTAEVMPAATQASGATAMPASTATPTPLAPGSVTLNGSGSTFQAPAESEYAFAFPLVDPAVVINYQPTGSGAGIKAITDGTVDFAGSDAVLNSDQITAGKDLQMYPFLAGATVLSYNIPELDPTKDPALILDGNTLVGIYNATITKWNDPAIVALNPKIASKLPAKQITVAHRSDGSGTTAIFTAALTSFSSAWTAGSGTTINWPADKAGNGVGGNGNPGVAAAIQNTPESIGYIEYAYAISNKLPFAQMVNKAGKTVTASPDSTASAMNDFANSFTPQLTNTIVNGTGDGSWPIAGYTYIIVHQTSMTDCVKASKLVEYINWILTNPVATSRAKALGYVPLSSAVQQLALAKLGQVTCNGQPVMTH